MLVTLYLVDLSFMQDPPGGFSSQEKTVSLKKEPRHSLGITIAGGRDCRSRLPVYITSVQPVGCLHRDGTIKRGTKEHLVICDSGLWPHTPSCKNESFLGFVLFF